jgi:hypothetical protein
MRDFLANLNAGSRRGGGSQCHGGKKGDEGYTFHLGNRDIET